MATPSPPPVVRNARAGPRLPPGETNDVLYITAMVREDGRKVRLPPSPASDKVPLPITSEGITEEPEWRVRPSTILKQ